VVYSIVTTLININSLTLCRLRLTFINVTVLKRFLLSYYYSFSAAAAASNLNLLSMLPVALLQGSDWRFCVLCDSDQLVAQ
jgi:ABC-type sulfate transport system permease component